MADKRFYQMAAEEVQAGQLDQALWIKVGADFPNESDVGKQAQYIRLRAAELSNTHKAGIARRLKPQKWWQWLLYVVISYIVAAVVAAIVGGDEVTTLIVVWLVLIALLVVAAIMLRSKSSA